MLLKFSAKFRVRTDERSGHRAGAELEDVGVEMTGGEIARARAATTTGDGAEATPAPEDNGWRTRLARLATIRRDAADEEAKEQARKRAAEDAIAANAEAEAADYGGFGRRGSAVGGANPLHAAQSRSMRVGRM